MSLTFQKEENGKILTTLPSSQNMYEQSGLGPGQEYEVSVGVIKNNTRGPQSTKIITTSKLTPHFNVCNVLFPSPV